MLENELLLINRVKRAAGKKSRELSLYVYVDHESDGLIRQSINKSISQSYSPFLNLVAIGFLICPVQSKL